MFAVDQPVVAPLAASDPSSRHDNDRPLQDLRLDPLAWRACRRPGEHPSVERRQWRSPEGDQVTGKAMSATGSSGPAASKSAKYTSRGESVMVWPLSRVQASTASYADRICG